MNSLCFNDFAKNSKKIQLRKKNHNKLNVILHFVISMI